MLVEEMEVVPLYVKEMVHGKLLVLSAGELVSFFLPKAFKY